MINSILSFCCGIDPTLIRYIGNVKLPFQLLYNFWKASSTCFAIENANNHYNQIRFTILFFGK